MAIGITLGDPAGIGPEVVAAALAAAPAALREQAIVFGDPDVLARGARAMGVAVAARCEGAACPDVVPGQPDARSGHREGAELGYGDAHEHEGGAPQRAEQQQLQEGPGIHATGTRWRSEKTRPQALAI